MDESYKSLEIPPELEEFPSPTSKDDARQQEENPPDLFDELDEVPYTEQLSMSGVESFLAPSSFAQVPNTGPLSYGFLPSDQSISRSSTRYLTTLTTVPSISAPHPDANSSSLALRRDHEVDDWLHPKKLPPNFAYIPTADADAYYFDGRSEPSVENTYWDNIYNTYDLLEVEDLEGAISGEQTGMYESLQEGRGCADGIDPSTLASSEPIFAHGSQKDLNEVYTFNSNTSPKECATRDDPGYPFTQNMLPLSPLSDFNPGEQFVFEDPIYTAGPNDKHVYFNSFGGIGPSTEYPLPRADMMQSVAQHLPRTPDQALSNHRPRATNRGNRATHSTAHLGRDLTPSEAKLLRLYAASFTYKQIKTEIPEYAHLADSTLRGKVRALVKSKEQRVRKPVWSARDEAALIATVEHLIEKEAARASRRNTDLQTQRLPFDQALKKLPWKKVTEMLAAQGFYHYGVFTAKKKYYQLMGIEKLLRDT